MANRIACSTSKKDPHEMEDLIGRKEHEGLIAELKSKLFDRRAQTQDV
jgi:hypothetical protein